MVEKKGRGRGRGRPAFEPTEADRKLVVSHVAFGTPQEDICTHIINPATGKPIDAKTLRQHFFNEIAVANTRADARVAESLFYQALGRPAQYDDEGKLLRDELKPSVSAAIFWLKARAGWSEFRPTPPVPPPRSPKTGKKQAAAEAAMDAGVGTSWGKDLLPN